jgi:NAD(P)-dependent dehydrogenase (short-subunit alcohol dehydrogenase family)
MQIDLQLAEMVQPRDLERVVGTAWRTYGRLDAVVCNAGFGLVGAIDTMDYAAMNEQLTVNTLAPAELARLSVPLMRRQGYGVLVGVSSLIGRTGLPGYGIYAASKHGLEGLFESLAMELRVSRIRVKLVEPSVVDTLFWKQPRKGLSTDGVAAVIFRAATDMSGQLRYPLGRTRMLGYARRLLPERWYLRLLGRLVAGS